MATAPRVEVTWRIVPPPLSRRRRLTRWLRAPSRERRYVVGLLWLNLALHSLASLVATLR